MADTPKVYVLCDQNCKYEGLTREQIIAAITQAVNEGTIGNIDTGFITTIKTINGTGLKFFVGEQHEYDALTADQKTGLFAIITNDATKDTITEMLARLELLPDKVANNASRISGVALNLSEYTSGLKVMPKARELNAVYEANDCIKVQMPTGSGGVEIALEANAIYLVWSYVGREGPFVLCTGSLDGLAYVSSIATADNGALRRLSYQQDSGTYKLYIQTTNGTTTSFSNASLIMGDYLYFIKIGALPNWWRQNPFNS